MPLVAVAARNCLSSDGQELHQELRMSCYLLIQGLPGKPGVGLNQGPSRHRLKTVHRSTTCPSPDTDTASLSAGAGASYGHVSLRQTVTRAASSYSKAEFYPQDARRPAMSSDT